MRVVLAAMLSVALGLLPIGTARAQEEPVQAAAAMSCHDQGSAGHDMGGDRSDHKQDCADHCLSQVNGQPSFARLSAPALLNTIRSELGDRVDLGKPHGRDPPDPPPPRV